MARTDLNEIAGTEFDRISSIERDCLSAGRSVRRGDPSLPWTGIALSGGGIRSATFCLGVLQSLAGKNLLKKFDYISSVSGGGYTAGSLQWWWSEKRLREERSLGAEESLTYGLGPNDFPFGTADPTEATPTGPGTDNLALLRQHGRYLTPGHGMNIWAGLAVVLRTLALSLLVWVPLLAIVFYLLRIVSKPISSLSPTVLSSVGIVACAVPNNGSACADPTELPYAVAISVALWIVVGLLYLSVVFGFLSRVQADVVRKAVGVYAIIALAASVILVFIVYRIATSFSEQQNTTKLFVALLKIVGPIFLIYATFHIVAIFRKVNASYLIRRSLEVWFGRVLSVALWLFVFWSIAFSAGELSRYVLNDQILGRAAGGFFGLFSVASGVISALYGHYLLVKNISPSLVGRLLAPVGAALFLYAVLAGSYLLAAFAWDHYPGLQSINLDPIGATPFVSVAVISVGLLLYANINQVGLHRFYRDRIMEAFMPQTPPLTPALRGYSPIADRLLLTDLVPEKPEELGRLPYPLVNTNVILPNDSDEKIAQRGGDSFILSPLYIGSSATGWDPTASHIKRNGPLTLATAVATSGAAANAGAGYAGRGPTRNPLVALVMTFLNIRLGLWIENPAKKVWQSTPSYWRPMLTAGYLGIGRNRKGAFVELSDGGHFENLGLYELVRRKLDIILVVDGEADPSTSLPALVSASRRIKEDFNATIEFDAKEGLERLIPNETKSEARYPTGAKFARSPFFVGTIHYAEGDRKTGLLVYLKTTLLAESYFGIRGYRAHNPEFPNESTGDQFFDPDQFEAYRELGFFCASQMIGGLRLEETLDDPTNIKAAYLAGGQQEKKRIQQEPAENSGDTKHQGAP